MVGSFTIVPAALQFQMSAKHSNGTKCIFRERIDSGIVGVFCDVILQNNSFQFGLDRPSNCFDASRRCFVEFSSQLFVLLKSSASVLPPKMKAPSFQQISMILLVIIDGH